MPSQGLGGLDVLADLFVDRLKPAAGSQDDLSTDAARHRGAETLLEHVGDLALRHADVLVEIDDGSLDVGADLTTVHTEGAWHEIRVVTVATENAAGVPRARQSRAQFLPGDEISAVPCRSWIGIPWPNPCTRPPTSCMAKARIKPSTGAND
jgi:hypothetical protein